MSCGMYDDYESVPRVSDLDEEARWVTLWVYGRKVSIEEGLLVPVNIQQDGEMIEVCFSDRLYAKYGGIPATLQRIFDDGFKMLSNPRKSDNAQYRRRRVQEDILLVQDRYGIMFISPEDW